MYNSKLKNMKKNVFYLLIVAVLAGMSACGDGGNKPIDPNKVTVNDILGEYRLESAMLEGHDQMMCMIVEVQKDLILIDGGHNKFTYSIKDGIITVNMVRWNSQTQQEYTEPVDFEIVSFDKNTHKGVLKEKNYTGWPYDDPTANGEIKGDLILTFGPLPAPSGKDVTVNEANVKGKWVLEYSVYKSEFTPKDGSEGYRETSKSYPPHKVYYEFKDNHIYCNSMVANHGGREDVYEHPGFWWLSNGSLYFIEDSYGSIEDYDLNNWNYNIYKVETLKADFMVLHCTWANDNDNGSSRGEEILYLSRAK